MLSIRKEQSNDYQIIDELIKEAFATAEYTCEFLSFVL